MHIDWITVVAQAVNFLILVYLLKRFLYAPIVRAMKRREEVIAEQIREAISREQVATEEALKYQKKTLEFEQSRQSRLDSLTLEVELQRKEMLENARAEIEKLRVAWMRGLKREQHEFHAVLKSKMAFTMTQTIRQILVDLAEASLEQQLVRIMVGRIKALDDQQYALLRTNIQKATSVNITTAFHTDESMRLLLKETVCDHLLGSAKMEYDFIVSSELLCGVEIRIGDYELVWTMDSYLKSLVQEINREMSVALVLDDNRDA